MHRLAAELSPRRLSSKALRGPDRIDRVLGYGTLVMLAIMLAALARGRAHWGALPGPVWFHLVTVGIALILTPALLWQRRGDTRHRWLGYVWVVMLTMTAIDSFWVRGLRPGKLSPIHLISAWVLFLMVRLVRAARRHDHTTHRRAVRGTVAGGLIIAGLFTLPFGRTLGTWLLGG